jgi:hypothetical protein
MDFGNRIKKEMAEGVVRALLEDAGYRVIETGIENMCREAASMDKVSYLKLNFSDAFRRLPDLIVMDREQTEQVAVEIKYRSDWDGELFDQVAAQVKTYKYIVLICINSNAPNPNNYENAPSRFLRCCRLRFVNNNYEIEIKRADFEGNGHAWIDVASVKDHKDLWWKLSPLQEIFPLIHEQANRKTLINSIEAISGILSK